MRARTRSGAWPGPRVAMKVSEGSIVRVAGIEGCSVVEGPGQHRPAWERTLRRGRARRRRGGRRATPSQRLPRYRAGARRARRSLAPAAPVLDFVRGCGDLGQRPQFGLGEHRRRRRRWRRVDDRGPAGTGGQLSRRGVRAGWRRTRGIVRGRVPREPRRRRPDRGGHPGSRGPGQRVLAALRRRLLKIGVAEAAFSLLAGGSGRPLQPFTARSRLLLCSACGQNPGCQGRRGQAVGPRFPPAPEAGSLAPTSGPRARPLQAPFSFLF